jgi:hypothetical protein
MAEATKERKSSALFEEVFQNIRKAAETGLKMQQEMLSQWSVLWPGVPTPQSAWLNQVQQFRSKFMSTVAELARKHGDVIDRQYRAALESLDAALDATEASTPEEARRKTEHLCRKTLDCMREMTETQIREFQDAITKWTDLLAKTGP